MKLRGTTLISIRFSRLSRRHLRNNLKQKRGKTFNLYCASYTVNLINQVQHRTLLVWIIYFDNCHFYHCYQYLYPNIRLLSQGYQNLKIIQDVCRFQTDKTNVAFINWKPSTIMDRNVHMQSIKMHFKKLNNLFMVSSES